jgi:hypothetical protein
MRIGKACKALGGIDNDTLKNWIERPELAKFFSATAHGDGRTQREITESDLIILNTVRSLRVTGTSEWVAIAKRLDGGYRDTELPIEAAFVEGTASVQVYNNALATTKELNETRQLVVELRSEIDRLHKERVADLKELYREQRAELKLEQQEHQQERDRIHKELEDANVRLQVAEEKLRLYEAGRLAAPDWVGQGK